MIAHCSCQSGSQDPYLLHCVPQNISSFWLITVPDKKVSTAPNWEVSAFCPPLEESQFTLGVEKLCTFMKIGAKPSIS